MNIFMKTTIEPPHSRRFTRTTTAENELLLGEDALSLITCVEDRQLFAGVRDSVHQQFAPRTLYEQNMADSIAEDLWRKSRFSTAETAALSATIERDWELISKECANADPAYRTFAALRDLGPREVACLRAAQESETRAWRRSRSDAAVLAALKAKPL